MYTLGMQIEEKGEEEHLSSSIHDSCLSLTPGYPDALINSAELLIRGTCSFCQKGCWFSTQNADNHPLLFLPKPDVISFLSFQNIHQQCSAGDQIETSQDFQKQVLNKNYGRSLFCSKLLH